MEIQEKSWVDKFLFFLFYLLITIVFVSLGPMIFSLNWVSSSDFHACIEISSSVIALIAAISVLAYFFSKKNRYFLLVAIGFFICGIEDFAHGILGFISLFAKGDVDFYKYIPGSYVAGRVFLAITVIAAIVFEKKSGIVKHAKQEALFFSALALLFGGSAIAIALIFPLPLLIFPENLVSRPVDFIAALLFAAAFFSFLNVF